MPGCTLYVSGEVVSLITPVLNFGTWSIDLCACPQLIGVPIYNQGFVYDPFFNAVGMTATNAGGGVVGFR